MLHSIRPTKGSRTSKKRVARGSSAGGGTTAGRGTKGQNARTGGGKRYRGFEGGQTPLMRRQPKLGGFTSPNRTEYEVINISTLETQLEPGTYTIESLKAAGIVATKKPVKLLANGTLTKKFNITVHAASKTAKEAISTAGGSVTIL